MLKNKILHKNYTLNQSYYQFKLPLNIECRIPADDPVRLLSQFVEEMDLSVLYETYSRVRENTATPRQMLKLVIYAYMNGIFSSREMETACKRDINFLYLLEGIPAPDHATFARFRSLHLAPCEKQVFAEMTELIRRLGEISGHTIFIDGTKIEAYANRYTFVWKKAVTKNQAKLLERLAGFVGECEELYDIKLAYQKQVKSKHVKKLRKKLYALAREEGIRFVHGSGRRKTPLQKSIESLEDYLLRLKDYTKKLHVCGARNSYSKTDPDATFMRLKDDAMKNGQLKPAYNLQQGVDSEYITWLSIGVQPTDPGTLIPFLKDLEENLSFKYKEIVTDAGYESEENYSYIEDNQQIAFIKPANYEISKTRKYQKDISRIENMEYNEAEDFYICQAGKHLKKVAVFNRRSKTGYEREKTTYLCEDCTGCEYKADCIKGSNWKIPPEERTKRLETSKKFNHQRKECLGRITSERGCQLRMNRRIQVEGAFGVIKQDMGFRRYLCRGAENVKVESMLLAMAFNVKKLHSKIQNERTGSHLFKLKDSA